MKKLIVFATTAILYYSPAQAQVKFWDKDRKPLKTKGAYLTISAKQTDGEAAFIPGFTVVGTLLPFAFKIGNKMIQNATERKEEDYKSEYASYNKISFKDSALLNTHNIYGKIEYVKKGKEEVGMGDASTFCFSISKRNSEVSISYQPDKSSMNLSSVKTKRKYDMLVTQIKLSLKSSVVFENTEDGYSFSTEIDLGTAEFYHITNSFLSSTEQGKMLIDRIKIGLSDRNEDGYKITYKSIIVGMEINQMNPLGLTQSSIHKFLTDNAETNEELLNTIFISN